MVVIKIAEHLEELDRHTVPAYLEGKEACYPGDQGPFLPWSVLVSGVIYLGTYANFGPNSEAVALRARDGTVLWKHNAVSPDFGPMLVDDGVLISNSNTSPVYALNTSDGSQVWQSPNTPEGDWFPAPAGVPEALGTDSSGSGMLYVGTADGMLHALRMSDGGQLWQHPVSSFSAANDGQLCCLYTPTHVSLA